MNYQCMQQHKNMMSRERIQTQGSVLYDAIHMKVYKTITFNVGSQKQVSGGLETGEGESNRQGAEGNSLECQKPFSIVVVLVCVVNRF